MKPILFPGDETSFLSNGLGRLDPITCTVTEERNGQYELEMVVTMDDPHFADIQEGRLLLARHDDTTDKQPFEIYYISRPINGLVTVLAHHITYRTAAMTVMPFTASGVVAALLGLSTNTVGTCPFTFTTTKSTSGTFKVEAPSSLRPLLAGQQGSILDVYGSGEYEWDKFTIRLHSARGSDSGVVLRYGKDITDLKKVTDMSSIWTGVVPFWRGVDSEDNTTETLVTLTEEVLYSSAVGTYDYEMIVPLDLSSSFESQPTEAQLRAAEQAWVTVNEITAIPASIDVSFVHLAQTDEYQSVAAMQRLKLCDTLTVLYTKLGVQNKAKIVKTVYNVLLERYDSMTIGDIRPDLSTTLTGGLQASLNDLEEKAATKTDLAKASAILEGEYQQAIQDATDLITGGTGGYVVLGQDANGKPTEIFIMNTDDVSTATNVLRLNVNGIGFSSSGVGGPYTSAWTLDGRFVADFIQTGTLNANLIRAGTISDATGNNTWNLATGAMSFETLSWTSTYSSMSALGELSCTGASIKGYFKSSSVTGGRASTLELDDGMLTLLNFPWSGTGDPTPPSTETNTIHLNIYQDYTASSAKNSVIEASDGDNLLLWAHTNGHASTASGTVSSFINLSPNNVEISAAQSIDLMSLVSICGGVQVQTGLASYMPGLSVTYNLSGGGSLVFIDGILVNYST